MNIEVRPTGKGKKYYLAHSYRVGKKVKKIRIYLGTNLTKSELAAARKKASIILDKRIPASKESQDPYLTLLTKTELKELESLTSDREIRVIHLSEAEWQRFTEIFTYNTNAIEGSKVGKNEVKDLLEKNKLPEKSKEDIAETFGVADAVKYIRGTKEHLSLDLIKTLHWSCFKNSKSFAGQFRRKGIEVGVYDRLGNVVHRGALSTKILPLLKDLIKWYEKSKNRYPPLLLAAIIHNQFENIHPFEDGNGRVGRLLLVNILIKHGLPPVNIELELREEYYNTLQAYERRNDIKPTLELLLKEYRKLKKELKVG
jgi:Fic family protein